MQQRLIDIGKWLEVNGDAIYGTRAFITSKNEESINPETNKNIFFTKKDNALYVILLQWPDREIVLKGLERSSQFAISLLGSDAKVKSRISGSNMIITLPALTPDDYQPAYVLKISN